jgi:hypothetical protein
LNSIRRGIKSISTMLPRRRVDPPVANRAMEREMRELCARLDSMETTQRRVPDARDVSKEENEEVKFEEAVAGDAAKECLLKEVVKLSPERRLTSRCMKEIYT